MSAKLKVNIDTRIAEEAFRLGGAQGIRDCANYILDESRKQVPLDTGALMRSGTTDTDGLSAAVSYDTPYAVRWHEHDANFQRGRKKKYLEDVINDGGVQQRCMDYLKNAIKF